MAIDWSDPGYEVRVGDVIAFDICFQALHEDALIVACYSDGTPIERSQVIRKRDATWPSCLPALLVALPDQPYRPIAWSPDVGWARRAEAGWSPPGVVEPDLPGAGPE